MKMILVCVLSTAMFLTGCATSDENKATAKGAGIGVGAGAVLGGVLGHQMGKGKEGAVLGAVLGGAVGGHMGRRLDKQAKELEKVAETKRTEDGLVSRLKGDILFDTGKADLKATAKNDLKEMAEIMKKYPENLLTINGYTDNTGSSAINETLSKKRADAVKATLIANGMPEETIKTQGWGPAKPVAENTTPDGRQKNRRVEVEVTVDPAKVPQEK